MDKIPDYVRLRELTYSGWLHLVKHLDISPNEDTMSLHREYDKWLSSSDGVYADIIKHIMYNKYPHMRYVSLFDLIRDLEEDGVIHARYIFHGLKKLYVDKQITFSLDSSCGSYTVLRAVQYNPIDWENFKYGRGDEEFISKIRLAYRHGFKKKELDMVIEIMAELIKHSVRIKLTWTHVTKQERFYETGYFEESM